MEAVADGNSSGSYAEPASVALTINEMLIQRLPMYIRFPLFGTDLLSVCRLQQQYTSLGLENIFIPGFLIGFCHSFDLARGHGSKIYYTTTFVGKIHTLIFFTSSDLSKFMRALRLSTHEIFTQCFVVIRDW